MGANGLGMILSEDHRSLTEPKPPYSRTDMDSRIMRYLLFLSLLLLLTAGIGIAQPPASAPRSKMIDVSSLFTDLMNLSADDMEGRLVGSKGGVKAREYVLTRFKQSGILPFAKSYLQPFEFSYPKKPDEKIQGANVIGYIEGTQTPEKYIVVTAHYDHLGIIKGEIYNGADDNASGTASLFAIAQYFNKHRPANSIIFVATDAEEGSGAGGLTFIKNPPVRRNLLVMDVNIDAIARDKNNILYAVGAYDYPFFRPYLEKVASRSSIKLVLGHDDPNRDKGEDYWPTLQDGMSFRDNGIPYIYFGVEDNEQIHKPTDDYLTITPNFYVRAVETIIAAIEQFDGNLPEIETRKKLK